MLTQDFLTRWISVLYKIDRLADPQRYNKACLIELQRQAPHVAAQSIKANWLEGGKSPAWLYQALYQADQIYRALEAFEKLPDYSGEL